jgi:hypothetical protein
MVGIGPDDMKGAEMAKVSTGFTSKDDGFQFTNRFTHRFEYKFPLIGEIDLGSLVIGLCGGMCFATLDYFQAGRGIPAQSQIPASGSNLRKYLERRQVDSLIPPRGVLKVLTWMVRSDRSIGGFTSRTEFRMLRTRIKRGEPAVLALIRADRRDDATKNHQVVATGYDFDGRSRHLSIDLYDPNRPGRSPTLELDLNRPGVDGWIRQSSGEPLRGFFVIDYRRAALPAI